jgi:O-antigen/teichoic acid export membrane protein
VASLRSSAAASYASQIYVALLGIVVMPLYLHYMGAEAYGLVGVFMLLQAWFQVLDLGLAPTLSREAARYRGGVITAAELLGLLSGMEWVSAGVVLASAALVVASAGWIASHWLGVEMLPLEVVATSIVLMGLAVPLRWMCGLYRGAVQGLEHLGWLAVANGVFGTLRFLGALVLLQTVTNGLVEFFVYQLAVSVLELACMALATHRFMPAHSGNKVAVLDALRKVYRFSVAISLAGIVWVLVTQIDKFLLSKALSLAAFGYVSLAAAVASGVMLLGGPIASVIMPRLTRLAAAGQKNELETLYLNATEWTCLIVLPAAAILVLFPSQVMTAWTGDAGAASNTANLVTLYSLGNLLLVFAAFPYYLQYAYGRVRAHTVVNVVLAILMVPAVVAGINHAGALGAAAAWLGAIAAYFLLWVPLAHRWYAQGLYFPWLWCIGKLTAVGFGTAALVGWLMPWSGHRGWLALCLVVVWAGATFIVALASRDLRSLVASFLARYRPPQQQAK